MKSNRIEMVVRMSRAWLAMNLVVVMLVLMSGCGELGKGGPEVGGDVPDDLRVDGTPVATVHASGFQVYVCTAEAGGKLAWKLKAPDATFENSSGLKGKHYAGPTWEADDGSKVVARKLKEHASPTPDAVAWLLLEATSHSGNGALANVTYIQRIHTTGGKAPALGNAKEGEITKVPYKADYVFYGPGATVHSKS